MVKKGDNRIEKMGPTSHDPKDYNHVYWASFMVWRKCGVMKS